MIMTYRQEVLSPAYPAKSIFAGISKIMSHTHIYIYIYVYIYIMYIYIYIYKSGPNLEAHMKITFPVN